MKSLSRRHFLRHGITVAGVLCVSPLTILSQNSTSSTSTSQPPLSELEAQARAAYNKHLFADSLALYRQLIDRNSAEVAYYDGAVKALKQLNDPYAIIDTYKGGMRQNPDMVVYYVRLAKYYREVYEGNRSLCRRLSAVESENLLQAAINYLKRAIGIVPSTIVYFELIECLQTRYRFAHSRRGAPRMRREQVRDLLLIDNSPEGVLVRPYVERWYSQHAPVIARRQASGVTSRRVASAPQEKRRRTLYHEKEKRQREHGLYYHHVDCEYRALEENVSLSSRSNSETIDRVCSFIHAHPQQSNVLGVTRGRLRHSSVEGQLLKLNDSWAASNPTPWSLIALAATQVHQRLASAAEMSLSKINKKLPQMHKATAAFYGVKAQTALAKTDYESARRYILEAFMERDLKGGASLSLLYLYARSYAMEGNADASLELLRVRLDAGRVSPIADPILPYISPKYAEIPSLFITAHRPLTTEERISLWCEMAKNGRIVGNTTAITEAEKKIRELRSTLKS